ncbi:SIMPL domain-containing protein [Cellulomonas xylanilytica]|uniref:Putative conserved lipoprotein LpqG n=1 Tax=Cellulomonas xylanilytica TaxID=233583 RepID=A0A510V380_9CELL|nr:SIMPL domain-containing protein [Cellulomonas xylanilytica]GEK21334.1 putative conserved lipoprotein LpqG [Cellulomonas xylanilytica]
MDGRDDDTLRRRGPRGGVTVTGAGEAEAVPDRAVADLGAEARAVDAERALAEAGACLERMRAVLRDAGVDDLAMRTTQSSTWTDGSAVGSSRVVARLGLQVTLRDVAVAGDVVGAAVVAGGEPARMDGIRLEISDPTEPRARAREAAWADAVARATQWAALSGRSLGEVQWVTEGGSDAAPLRLSRGMGVAKATSVPVEAGQQTVSADVTVRWAWAEDASAL